jgi:hypothetical protein
MHDQAAVSAWLAEVLGGDAVLSAMVGGRLYSSPPQAAEFPLAMWGLRQSSSIAALDGMGRLERSAWQVEAVGMGGGYEDLRPIADRIDALLSGAVGTPAGWRFRAARDSSLQFAEDHAGVRYHHLGAVWRIWSTEA